MLKLAPLIAERIDLPDGPTLAVIDWLCGRTARTLRNAPDEEDAFVQAMAAFPVAHHTEAANQQHYELPADFFSAFLGEQKKYSCAYYPDAETSLDAAEAHALRETCAHADLHDGQVILELGCGWGALSLWMAYAYPQSRIVAVSNSHSQRAYITAQAARRGLNNLTVLTADMNDFTVEIRFDRIVSVEMFEHMSNWRELLQRAHGWLRADGRLFLHVFTHKSRSYRFNPDPDDWIGKYFFTGGLMPAHDLPHRFPDLFRVEAEWRWDGTHYKRTALDWLRNFDRYADRIRPILTEVYGCDAELWRRRWRLFFLATAGLWGHARGQEWGVGHYRLAPAA